MKVHPAFFIKAITSSSTDAASPAVPHFTRFGIPSSIIKLHNSIVLFRFAVKFSSAIKTYPRLYCSVRNFRCFTTNFGELKRAIC